MKKTKTERGFDLIEFKDSYEVECSIQKSSIATEDAIWLGVNDADPKILHGEAARLGIKHNETSGWVDYPIPDGVSMRTRMHLNIDQVKKLIPILQKFVKTGDI